MYIADGDYIKDIEVNDLRNRYTLTKGSTQKMVNIFVTPTDAPRHESFKSTLNMRFYIPFLLPFVGEYFKLTLGWNSIVQSLFGLC